MALPERDLAGNGLRLRARTKRVLSIEQPESFLTGNGLAALRPDYRAWLSRRTAVVQHTETLGALAADRLRSAPSAKIGISNTERSLEIICRSTGHGSTEQHLAKADATI